MGTSVLKLETLKQEEYYEVPVLSWFVPFSSFPNITADTTKENNDKQQETPYGRQHRSQHMVVIIDWYRAPVSFETICASTLKQTNE